MVTMKKFLILGNINSVSCKDIFPLFVNNEFWISPSIINGTVKFYVPDDYEVKSKSGGRNLDGTKYINVKGVRWFTNIGERRYSEPLILNKRYSSGEYIMFDEYPAINVDKRKDIPYDYEGIMGVPLTFLDKYNPRQFEIVGKAMHGNSTQCLDLFVPYINGKKKYIRILIRKKINK